MAKLIFTSNLHEVLGIEYCFYEL